jgi:hypothetical protein
VGCIEAKIKPYLLLLDLSLFDGSTGLGVAG